MKFVLIALFATLYVALAQHRTPQLPEVLIARARVIIQFAEAELHKHHEQGRHHLTQALEHEIEEVRKLEHELMALEQHKHIELHKVHEYEERLLHHENRLIEESIAIEERHRHEKENEHKEHEHKEHEHKEQDHLLHY